MNRDYTVVLWLLKLGVLGNLYFMVSTYSLASVDADVLISIPAQILFAVSAYRCLFPVRYEHNVVLHESIFSSVFVTRLLATFSEVAYIFLFSHVLRLLNVADVSWVNALSWAMVVQVVISQALVWTAVLSGKLEFYFYEEFGWALIFAANTIASAYLYWAVDSAADEEILLQLNLLFGLFYLPWQFMHLRKLREDGRRSHGAAESWTLMVGLKRAIAVKNRRTDADSWGGVIGLTWMSSYWATLIPLWIYTIVRVLCA